MQMPTGFLLDEFLLPDSVQAALFLSLFHDSFFLPWFLSLSLNRFLYQSLSFYHFSFHRIYIFCSTKIRFSLAIVVLLLLLVLVAQLKKNCFENERYFAIEHQSLHHEFNIFTFQPSTILKLRVCCIIMIFHSTLPQLRLQPFPSARQRNQFNCMNCRVKSKSSTEKLWKKMKTMQILFEILS